MDSLFNADVITAIGALGPTALIAVFLTVIVYMMLRKLSEEGKLAREQMNAQREDHEKDLKRVIDSHKEIVSMITKTKDGDPTKRNGDPRIK
jgi:hypothetical protein